MKIVITFAACIALALGAPAPAQTPPLTMVNELNGTVGGHRIGLSMTMRDEQFIAAHYFYVSHLTDIPLSGRIDGEAVTLTEPGGAVFHLHYINDQPHKAPLDFDHAFGMAGTWTDGKTVLPVSLAIAFGDVDDGNGRYSMVTGATDEEYEALVRRFLHGALTGNRAETAGAVSYPLTVNGARHLVIRNKAGLYAHWNEIFTPKYLAILRQAVPHDMFVSEEKVMICNGEAWFDGRGATSLNVS